MRVHTHTDNVAGVKLPVFRQYEIQSEVKSKSDRDNLGLAQGGRQIKACKEKFSVFLTNLVRLASLQTSFITLDEALKVCEKEYVCMYIILGDVCLHSTSLTHAYSLTHTHTSSLSRSPTAA